MKPSSDAEIEKILTSGREKYNVRHFGFGSFTGYYNLKEVNAQLDSMHALFPSLISEKRSIGTTHENRPIYSVTITGPGITKVSKPQSLYTAMHHGREPEGMMVLIYFMYYLLEN